MACKSPLLLLFGTVALCLLLACSGSRKQNSPPTPQGWTQLTVPGPTPRWTHGAVLDPARQDAVMFGGFNAGNEVWIFSFDSRSWTQVNAPNGPTPRGSPAIISDPASDRMVVVGGFPASGATNEVWAFSFANHTWTPLPTGPSARFDMGAATDGSHAWFFGGFLANFQATNELWQLDLATDTWTQLPQSQPAPSPRTNIGIGLNAGSLFIIGGHDQNELTPGTWQYQLMSRNWTQLSSTGTLGAGAHFASATDNACGVLFLAGGDHDDDIDVNTTDIFSFSQDSFARLPTNTDFSPSRRHSVLVLEPQTRTLLLFGGIHDPMQVLGDSWIYQLGSCSQ